MTRDTVRGRLMQVVTDTTACLPTPPALRFSGLLDALPDPITEDLVAVLRESLTNVARHAHASGSRTSSPRRSSWANASATASSATSTDPDHARTARHSRSWIWSYAARTASAQAPPASVIPSASIATVASCTTLQGSDRPEA